jgi:hypothetical protein
MYLSYSGELEQSYQFKIDKRIFKNNFDATNNLLSALGKPVDKPLNDENKNQKFIWQGKNTVNAITTFLQCFEIGEEITDTSKISDYINAQAKRGNLVDWTIALINNSTAKQEDTFFFPGLSEKVGLTNRTNVSKLQNDYEVTKANITDHRHELIDLTKQEIIEAKAQTIADSKMEGNIDIPELPSRKRIKWKRSSHNGLLIIYPLNHNCDRIIDDTTKPKTTQKELISDVPIIGIAISFPEIENDEKIEYAVNQQFKTEELDYDEELDQNDLTDGSY